MTTTTAPPAPDRRETPARPRVPYTGLFREPVYADGRPYDSDDEDDDGPGDAG
jgi:hypothetical protein